MRSLLLFLLLLASPAIATDLESCLAGSIDAPAAQRERAARELALGGGTPWRICEALALEAMGARRAAATALSELAQDQTAGLDPEDRAELADAASALWQEVGQFRLARLLAQSGDRLVTLARAEASVGDWQGLLETLDRLGAVKGSDRPLLRARALIELGQSTRAREVLAPLPRTPTSELERARLQLEMGETADAAARLASIATMDPTLRAEKQRLLRRLLAASPPKVAPSDELRPRLRRP